MLTGLPALLRTHWRILRREPGYWIVTLGLAATIIVVYGSLLSNPSSPELGFALNDDSPVLAEAVADLDGIDGIDIEVGTQAEELQALQDGDRWAVLVVPDGVIDAVGRGEPASADLLYEDDDPFQSAAARGILREFVADLNEGLGVTDNLSLEEIVVPGEKGIGLLGTIFPGLVGMSLMFGNSWAAATLVGWRQLGILKRLSSSPVNPFTIQIAQFSIFAILSALQVTVLVALGQLLFDVHIAGSYLTLAAVAAVGALAFMGIWYALASFMTNSAGFFATLNLSAFVMVFLGGSVVPNDDVPGWLDPLIQALPLTHLNDALRSVINDAASLSSVADQLLILGAWAIAGFALSSRLFRWAPR